MDYAEIAASISETIEQVTRRLSKEQMTMLAGALAVWLDKAVKDEREACAMVAEEFEDDMGHGKAQKIADKIRMRSNDQLNGVGFSPSPVEAIVGRKEE